MSQGSLKIPTTGTLSGLALVQAINAALANLAGMATGTTDPSSLPGGVEANSLWFDTSVNPGVIRQRNAANTGWTGASIAPATQPQHAVQFSQVSGVVGQSRNAFMNIATAGVTGTFTADELIVETGLGGLRYCLANVSDTFNLTTDMDTGSAPTSGFVALYKLFNPATGASARRIVNSTSIIAPETFAGANPPAGFTASALCGVVPTNPSGQFIPCSLTDRTVSFVPISILGTTGVSPSFSSLPLAAAVPKNGKAIKFEMSAANNATSTPVVVAFAGSILGFSQASLSGTNSGSGSGLSGNGAVTLTTPQTAFLKIPIPASGTQTTAISINEYRF